MTDEEIKEYLVKGVQRCSLLAMELVHGRSLQLPETRGMYVLASRAWVEEQQSKEQRAEAELYYEPTPAPVKKVKLKRKRHIKEETEDKKAEEAADPAAEPAASADATDATELAEPASEALPPPEPTQVSHDIIPAPEPQVHDFGQEVAEGLPGVARWVQGGCKAVARFRQLLSSGVTRRLHILARDFKRCHEAVAYFSGCFQAVS